MINPSALRALCIVSCVISTNTMAEVTHSSEHSFISSHSFHVNTDIKQSFTDLTENIGQWWHSDHTYSGDASNMTLEAKAGGCFCERWGNNEVQHLRVVMSRPPQQLRLVGGLGPLQQEAVNGVMDWQLSSTDDGKTKINMTYKVSGARPGSLAEWAAPVDQVLALQFEQLKKHLSSQ